MELIAQYGHIWLVVLPLVFLGAVVDSIAGGGGLISLPAYMMVLPPHIAAATNKFAASFGTLSSLVRFLKSGKVHLKVSLIAALGALIGSPIGAQIQLFLPEAWLNWLLLALLPCVAFFLMIRRDFGADDGKTDFTCTTKAAMQAFGIGLLIGGSAKVVNFASNIAALVVYLLHGQVMFAVGIPAMLCAILGYQVGAHMALRGGARVVRGLIFVVLGILLVKTGYTMLLPAV